MKSRMGLVSNSSSSCFVIFNKTDKVLTFQNFFNEFPQTLGNICDRANLSLDEAINKSKTIELFPGENYIDSSNENYDGDIIERDLRGALHGTRNHKSDSFEWEEVYNEQAF